jgi:putative transcriptional regulator
MNVAHHPTDLALASFAFGTLDEGRSLVLATHLWFCSACRKGARVFENAGGALLDRVEPAELRAGSFERALERIGPVERPPEPPLNPADPLLNNVEPFAMPGPLTPYSLGPWRRIGRGLHWRAVDVPPENDTRVILLDAAPGARLRQHRHTGLEWTCVLMGAFQDEYGRYGPGDFEQADDTVEHSPVAEDASNCLCLIALNGSILLQGRFGRLLQPFLRF